MSAARSRGPLMFEGYRVILLLDLARCTLKLRLALKPPQGPQCYLLLGLPLHLVCPQSDVSLAAITYFNLIIFIYLMYLCRVPILLYSYAISSHQVYVSHMFLFVYFLFCCKFQYRKIAHKKIYFVIDHFYLCKKVRNAFRTLVSFCPSGVQFKLY